jgi:stage V sporulation protein S
MTELRVGSNSDPNKVAGALAGTIREQGRAEMRTIGAGALNQAMKAIAIARGYLAPSGVDIWCFPAFVDIDVEGQQRTGIKLFVERRAPGGDVVVERPVEVSQPRAAADISARPPGQKKPKPKPEKRKDAGVSRWRKPPDRARAAHAGPGGTHMR